MNSPPVRRILVIDDDAAVVNAVGLELSKHPLGRYRYEVEEFTDPKAALERARQTPFDAVICDYSMPDMDGVSFLRAFRELQPACARLVLSGHTDSQVLIQMINELHIDHFIKKPWHDYYLKSALAQALDDAAENDEIARLSAEVVRLGVEVPAVISDEVQRILLVGRNLEELARVSQALTVHSPLDDVFSIIRERLAQQSEPRLDERRVCVQTCANGVSALKLAQSTPYACVIAEYALPDMSGADLLQQFLDRRPDCVRLLLCTSPSGHEVADALGAAHIYGVICSPWRDFELKACVAKALNWRRMSLEKRVLAEIIRAVRAGG